MESEGGRESGLERYVAEIEWKRIPVGSGLYGGERSSERGTVFENENVRTYVEAYMYEYVQTER